MRWMEQLRMRIEMLLLRGRAGGRLDDELRFHLEQQIAENVAAGMSADEGRHAALRAFGNPVALRDQARETWSWSGVELLLRDLRIGLRTLWRTPGVCGYRNRRDGVVHRGYDLAVHGDALGSAQTASFP